MFYLRRLYSVLAPRAYSVLMFAALFCTLAAKLFCSYRMNMTQRYLSWILADTAVLLGAEVALAVICFRWPKAWVIRVATVCAAVVCTWSILNAGWLIRTGTQILPIVLLPLIRDPLNALGIVAVNLLKMPTTTVMLLGPSLFGLAFVFLVLSKPLPPNYNRSFFANKIFVTLLIVFFAVLAGGAGRDKGADSIAAAGLRYNSQLRAVTTLLFSDSGQLTQSDAANANRQISAFDEIPVAPVQRTGRVGNNVIIVVLEGIQYRLTSLVDKRKDLTPYLARVAEEGLEFANTRSSLTHTTKALFALLTGRRPSHSQDIAEAVPVAKPYASIATILKEQLKYRTAFFQSAKGNFECRAGLVHNLGFDKFWARDDLNDPNAFVGYLGGDEFAMLEPITDWIKEDKKPFLITILCSVTHDPYEVPRWFGQPAKEPLLRYEQAIFYTDKFLAALDVELTKLNLTANTVLCVIGDHGEAFAEHGLLGHERIAFDEALRVPWVMRVPFWLNPGTKIAKPLCSVDLTPTVLALLGLDPSVIGFDGLNALGPVLEERKVYFSGWVQGGPAGYVQGDKKYIYYPGTDAVSVYNLAADPREQTRMEIDRDKAQKIAQQIMNWQKDSVFIINQRRVGETTVFRCWHCRWNNRVSTAKYRCGRE